MTVKNERINRKTILLLWALIAAGCLVIFHIYILGNYTVAFFDVGTDGKDQYIMWYNGIVNSIRDGNFSAWDFRNGFGMNTMGHHLTEPFLIPIYILGVIFGPEHITYYMVWMEVFRIFVAATACYYYLSEFEVSEKAKLLATLMYAFNSYMMVWGQHYALGSSVVYFPLILLAAERVIRKRKFGVGLCLICFLTMISSFYQGYMCMFGGGAYVCIRILMQEKMEWKERGKAFLLAAGSMILGVLMSAFRFFPSAAAQVGSSERMASQYSLFQRLFGFQLWDKEIIKTIIYRLFSSCIQGNGNELYVGRKNFYEDPNLFFSTLFIILLLQYVVLIRKQKVSRYKKNMQYLCVVVCVATVLVPNVTTLFNGLYKPFFRHTFVLMPVFAIMSAMTLDEILISKKISVPMLILASVTMLGIYMRAYTNRYMQEQQYTNNNLILCMTGLAMVIVLFLYCKEKIDVHSGYTLLVVLVGVNLISDSYLCYNHRVALAKDHPVYYSETYHSDVDAALDWLEEYDDTFYRVEKDYFTASSCFDSLAQDYRGISAYNSNQNADLKRYISQVWPMLYLERDVNHIQFMNAIWDSTFAALADVKYVLSKSVNLNLEGYEKIHQVGDISIYQNQKTKSLGTFFEKTITEQIFEEQKDSLNTPQLLSEVLITKEADDMTLTSEELQAYEKEEIPEVFSSEVKDRYEAVAKETSGYEPMEMDLELRVAKLKEYGTATLEFTLEAENRTEVVIQMNDGYTHTYVHNVEGPRSVQIELPLDTWKVGVSVPSPTGGVCISQVHIYGTSDQRQFSSQAEITVQAPEKDSYLTGHISAAKDGYVMLAVPNESGWSVKLNGETTEIFDGNYGFITFKIEAGEYDMEVIFEAPLLKIGIMVTVISTALFAVILILRKKRDTGRS